MGWHCSSCKAKVVDPARTEREQACADRAAQDDALAFADGNTETAAHYRSCTLRDCAVCAPLRDRAAAALHSRGVTVSWLVHFTARHGCWSWPTWR